jgi:alginate O-acetyltransferase complex protein AlgI
VVFSSLTFLYLFLPLTLAAYTLAPARARNGVALAASLLFFAWGAPRFVFLLVAGCLMDYVIGNRLAPGAAGAVARRRWLGLGLAVNLALLLYFKYANFGLEQLNALLALAGRGPLVWTRVALPIGISFFTFQKISYLMDVFRGTARPAANFGRYLLFIALFPQLIAGPIVRYHDVAAQLESRRTDAENRLAGAWRLALGLAKKCLLANPLALLADQAFGAAPGTLGAGAAWAGLYAYALQIYFDFSGYSDMALGLGRLMGFHFLENFDFPYISRGIGEFWRRWHISLGNFMREYLYIPLGGNRVAPARRAFNLWLVFLLSGFWHGAAWNFVIWGAWHGLWIVVEKRLAGRRGARARPAALAVPATFLLVLIGWVFFRAANLAAAGAYFRALAGLATAPAAPPPALADLRTATAMILGTGLSFAPLFTRRVPSHDWTVADGTPGAACRIILRTAATLALIGLSTLPLLLGGFNPFIYFRF